MKSTTTTTPTTTAKTCKLYSYLKSLFFGEKEEAVDVLDTVVYDGVGQTSHRRTGNEAAAAAMAAAMAGLRHNHTYMGTNEASDLVASSASTAAAAASTITGSIIDQSIELHPYSYKSKMLKRIQKSRMMNIKGENGSSRANQSRDEQALRDASIELSIEEVVDSSADDFNELIRAHEFTAEQINLLKDIRRRGKNKVAAQICRKRKLDSIDSLRDKVDELKSLRSELIAEQNAIHDEVPILTLTSLFNI